MKLMTGAELLLQKLKEWDKYAHREIKMAQETKTAEELCLRWRREELEGWGRLSQAKREQWGRKVAAQWWFRLYQILVLRAGAEAQDEEGEELLKEKEGEEGLKEKWEDEELTWLFQLLTEFIENGKIGDFPVRHTLLGVFAAHLFCRGMARSPSDSEAPSEHERFFSLLFLPFPFFPFLYFSLSIIFLLIDLLPKQGVGSSHCSSPSQPPCLLSPIFPNLPRNP